jgi:SAM-dependent methyltransferase
MSSSPPASPASIDWGIGSYEHTAAQLLPAARVVVECAGIQSGEHVVDVGCGTGNGALLAAERGARVTGVDPAPRLLEVARARATEKGFETAFVVGDAAGIPVSDNVADVVLSIFGVIFAPDAVAATREMARITAPGGRIVLSAWIPEGPISQIGRIFGMAIMKAVGAPPPAGPPMAWHDRDVLSGLLEPHGFDVTLEQHTHLFRASSLDEYLEQEVARHPLSVAGAAILEPRGELEPLIEQSREMLTAANEDPDAFQISHRYVIATARRR